ncbi:uncharacterized protein LOC143032317 [Oratosquilla oratoria]|uniref:uncharacterized protein LOC143032317 n=1 Tax=Oratosquilla oratoria TaxID=337810 RepID=UPI003F775659
MDQFQQICNEYTRGGGRRCVLCRKRRIDNPELKFHRFPIEKDRCAEWVDILKISELKGKTSQDLNRSKQLCSQHFSVIQYNSPCPRSRLRRDAVPDILNNRAPDSPMEEEEMEDDEPTMESKGTDMDDLITRDDMEEGNEMLKKPVIMLEKLPEVPEKPTEMAEMTEKPKKPDETPKKPVNSQTELEKDDMQMEPIEKCLIEDFPLPESRWRDSNLRTYKNSKRKHKETIDLSNSNTSASNSNKCKDSKRKCTETSGVKSVQDCAKTEVNDIAINSVSKPLPPTKDQLDVVSAMECHDYARILSEEPDDLELPLDNASSGDPVSDHDYTSSEAVNSSTKNSRDRFQLEKEAICSLIEKCNVQSSSCFKTLESDLDLDFTSGPVGLRGLDEDKVKKVFLIGPKNNIMSIKTGKLLNMFPKLGKESSSGISSELSPEASSGRHKSKPSPMKQNTASLKCSSESNLVKHISQGSAVRIISELPSVTTGMSMNGSRRDKAVQCQCNLVVTKGVVDQLKRNNTKLLHKHRVRYARLKKKYEKLEETSISLKEARKPSRILRDSATCLDRFQIGILGCMMLRSSVSAHGRRFSSLKKECVSKVFYKYPHTYDFLAKIFALPSKRSVAGWMQGISKGPGFREEIFELFKLRMDNVEVNDKICSIQFSCIPVENEPLETGNGVSGTINALCVMVRGIRMEWEQLLGYFLLQDVISMGDMLKTIISTCISKLDEYGFPVRVVMCDQSNTTIQFYEQMGVIPEAPFFFNGDTKIYCMYNPTQLLIKTRDTLKDHNIKVQRKVANWEHINELYEKDLKMKIRLVPRLMHPHVIAKDRVCTGVKMAAETMSYRVAAGLETHANLNSISAQAVDTAFFIYNIDQLFDVFNSLSENGRKKFQRGFQGDPGHLSFLKRVKEWINKWELVDRPGRIMCQDGWVQNISALTGLWDDVRTQHNTKILFTRRLNLDALDSFFELIRIKSLTEKKTIPSLKHLMDSYRYATFASLRKLVCEDDCVEELVKEIIKSSTSTCISENSVSDEAKQKPCDQSDSNQASQEGSACPPLVIRTYKNKWAKEIKNTSGEEAITVTVTVGSQGISSVDQDTDTEDYKLGNILREDDKAVSADGTHLISEPMNDTCNSPIFSQVGNTSKENEESIQLPSLPDFFDFTTVEKSPEKELLPEKNMPDLVSLSIDIDSPEKAESPTSVQKISISKNLFEEMENISNIGTVIISHSSPKKVENRNDPQTTSPHLNPVTVFTSMKPKSVPCAVRSTYEIKTDPDDSNSDWQVMKPPKTSSRDEFMPDLIIKHEPVECSSPIMEEEFFSCTEIELKSESVLKSEVKTVFEKAPNSNVQDQNVDFSSSVLSLIEDSGEVTEDLCMTMSRLVDQKTSPGVSEAPSGIPTNTSVVIHDPLVLDKETSGEECLLASTSHITQVEVTENTSELVQSLTSEVEPKNEGQISSSVVSLIQTGDADSPIQNQEDSPVVSKSLVDNTKKTVFMVSHQTPADEEERIKPSKPSVANVAKVRLKNKELRKGKASMKSRKMKLLNEMVRILESVSK